MLRFLYIIYGLVITAVVTAINVSDSDIGGRSSYRSWGSGSSYSSSGGSFHK